MQSTTATSSHRPSRDDWLLLALIVVLGAWLRFWGLGNLGLFADEELMGMPVMGVLETGFPQMPTGVLYTRAPIQIYLMAASVKAFGQSEWALRLPSVIAGTLMIPLFFSLARRFLTPRWALVPAFLIAVSPPMIAQSQTARMYIFYQVILVLFGLAVLRWERTDRLTDLFLAFGIYLIGLQFIRLTVFTALVFLFPGLNRRSPRSILLGGAALSASVLAQNHWRDLLRLIEEALGFEHPRTVGLARRTDTNVDALGQLASEHFPVLATLTVIMLALWWLATRALAPRPRDLGALAAVASLFVAVVSAATLHHHVAAIGWALGATLYLRSGGRFHRPAQLVLVMAITLAVQFFYLWDSGAYEGPRRVVMDLLGQPSPWPYVRFASFFPLAVAASALIVAFYWLEFARRKPLPDHVLFLLVTVWAPLFLMGMFKRDVPLRYVSGMLPFFVLASVAGLKGLLDRYGEWLLSRRVLAFAAAFALLLAFVRPTWLWLNVNPQHSDFPLPSLFHRGADHKGAAEFVKGLALNPDDIVIAEDVNQQTYYLGGVDYWLRSFNAGNYAMESDRGYVEIFTGTPQLGRANMLAELIDRRDRGAIYVIGSGETAELPEYYLGEEMLAVLKRSQPELLFVARDGHTKVHRISSPEPEAGRLGNAGAQ